MPVSRDNSFVGADGYGFVDALADGISHKNATTTTRRRTGVRYRAHCVRAARRHEDGRREVGWYERAERGSPRATSRSGQDRVYSFAAGYRVGGAGNVRRGRTGDTCDRCGRAGTGHAARKGQRTEIAVLQGAENWSAGA